MTTDDPLQSIRFIGRRARDWRHERNWTGQEAAARLGAKLGRLVEWAELRAYEEAATLPTSDTARSLAGVYGRQLAQLVLVSSSSTSIRREPWPPRSASPDELETVRGVLERRGHDPELAERFFELGASAGAAKTWLMKFSPGDAFGWLAVRFGPTEAEQWAQAEYSVEDALQLKELGLNPRDTAPALNRQLVDQGAESAVVLLWSQLALGESVAVRWMDSGWDLLSAIPWTLAAFDPSTASEWSAEGFDPMTARSLRTQMKAPTAGRWLRSEIEREEWGSWAARSFDPEEAAHWNAHQFDAPDAAGWRSLEFEPAVAAAFVRAEVAPSSAAGWRVEDVGPEEVRSWIDADLDASHVRRWRGITSDPIEVSVFEAAGLSPRTVREWLDYGIDGSDIVSWRNGGFTPEEAAEWSGTSPARALRLARRGVSPALDRLRRDAGSQRLAEARVRLRERVPPAPGPAQITHTSVSHAGPSVAVCSACGRPIGANGRCGCS